MDWIDPRHGLGLLHRLDIQIDHHSFVVAAHQHAFQRLGCRGIDLLMRHPGRNIDEVAGAALRLVFEMLAPTHPHPAPAARLIPGVCAVLLSSESAGMTLTPLAFQSIAAGVAIFSPSESLTMVCDHGNYT